MRSKIPLLVVLGFVAISDVGAQTTKPEVFASGGKTATVGATQVSYTIGEPMTQQFTAGNYILTQGFHQPIKGFVGIAENFNPTIQIFPNPTTDEIHVILPDNPGEYTMSIYNSAGQLVKTLVSAESKQKISLKEEAAASYFLQISGTSFSNQYTIIKIN